MKPVACRSLFSLDKRGAVLILTPFSPPGGALVLIRVEDIKEDGLRLDVVEEVASFPVLQGMVDRGECEFVQPVTVRLRVFSVSGLIEIEGDVSTAVKLSCGRCLEDFETAVESDVALTFVRELPEVEDLTGEEGAEISAEEMGLILLDGEEIDLRETVEEQVVLSLPIQPLCRRTCKGLCSQCGADLNAETCGCGSANVNLKFAALKDFKVKK